MFSQRIILLILQLRYRVASPLLIFQYSTLFYLAFPMFIFACIVRSGALKLCQQLYNVVSRILFALSFFCTLNQFPCLPWGRARQGTVKSYQQTSSTSRLISTSKVSSAPADLSCICICERIYSLLYCGFSSNWYCTTFPLSMCSCVTGVTSHISHIYKGINAMLIIRGPIKPYIPESKSPWLSF